MSTLPRSSWIYLFHGEDEVSSHEAVQGLVTRMNDAGAGEFNVSFFDGDKLSVPDLASTCQTIPFLSDKRLVVVKNALSYASEAGRSTSRDESTQERAPKGSRRALAEDLVQFLPSVPEFCRLVFLEESWIQERDPVQKAIRTLGGFVKEHRLDEGRLLLWIRDRARKLGCKISVEAIEELAAAIGPNARVLNSEILKLGTYCGDRQVEARDVRELVSDARKASVFAMVDALGMRQPEVALREVRKLLADGDHPLRISAMIVRQFRLLIQVKELSEDGSSPEEIAQKVGTSPRTVAGLQRQARNFSYGQLEEAYRRLLQFDFQVKTGAREPESALELLVVELLRVA